MPSRFVVVVVRHDDPTVGAAEAGLGPGDRERLAHASPDGRRRMLAGRAALREAASRFTGVPASALAIDARCPRCGRSHGRPRIVGAPMPVHVSLSHAGGRAFAVAAAAPVGVDAESRRMPAGRRAAVRDVAGAVAPFRGGAARRWTAVEAVLKADGRGLDVDPRAVVVRGRTGRVGEGPEGYRLTVRHRHGCTITVALAGAETGAGTGTAPQPDPAPQPAQSVDGPGTTAGGNAGSSV